MASNPAHTVSARRVIGSRKSDLAMWQAREVQAILADRFAAGNKEQFPIETEVALGDNVLDQSLAALAAANPGVFTKELEVGLLGGAYSIAVHSLKDMPTNLPPGLELVGISAREDPRDAVVLALRHIPAGGGSMRGLADLPAGSIVGTSSVRREAQLKAAYPQLTIVGVRGNLNTRLRKLDTPPQQAASVTAGEVQSPAGSIAGASGPSGAEATQPVAQHYDALVLAAAGLARMGWGDRITERLPPAEFPYGVSQGALGIEVRVGDATASTLGRAISHGPTALRCITERAFLRKLQGGCQVPVGVCSWYEDGEGKDGLEGCGPAGAPSTALRGVQDGQAERPRVLTVHGTVMSLDGSTTITATVSEPLLVPEPPAEGSGAAVSAKTGLAAMTIPRHGALMSRAQWDRLVEEGDKLGQALADKVLKAGAADLLAPLGLGQVRPITYGAAETAGAGAGATA